MERLLHDSRLPLEKSWPALDLKRLPARVVQQARTLLEGSFVDRCENVLVFGQPGSGKTHLLCAIGQELVRAGRKVLFRKCGLLVQELLAAKRDLKLPKMLKQMAGWQALILDDLGYVQQSREEMEVLFLLLAERYERGSVLLTSNLPFSGWEAIFKDAMTTAAAIDRLVHHSVIVELNVSSYRAEQAKKAKQGRSDRGRRNCPPLGRSSREEMRTGKERRDFSRHELGCPRGEENRPRNHLRGRGRLEMHPWRTLGRVIPCRVASPQSPTPFHPARETVADNPSATQCHLQGRSGKVIVVGFAP